jgi:NAD(P)-dependent dehydrogenase (short-subunit alcohol dehydrogenase family)
MSEARISLAKKVCIVTGSARGIGRGIVEEMVRRGAHVVVNDIDPGPLEETVAALSTGGEVIGVAADVSTTEGGQQLTDAALERWGRVDVLVNNAGVTRDALFFKMTEADWDRVMATHVRALFTCTQPVVRHLIERRKRDPSETGGSIICMSSTSGLAGNVGQTNYGAAKAAVLGFVLSLAKEMQRNDTRVNAIAPTAWTRLVSAIPEKVLLKQLGEEGLRRMQAKRPEHIAPVVCYLASDAAAGITGQFIRAAGDLIGLMSHPASIISRTTDGEWTVETLAEAFEELRPSLESLSTLGEL